MGDEWEQGPDATEGQPNQDDIDKRIEEIKRIVTKGANEVQQRLLNEVMEQESRCDGRSEGGEKPEDSRHRAAQPDPHPKTDDIDCRVNEVKRIGGLSQRPKPDRTTPSSILFRGRQPEDN